MKRAWTWLRDLAALTASQRRLLVLSLLLMFVARLASLVLPASSRFLIDNVLRGRPHWALSPRISPPQAPWVIQRSLPPLPSGKYPSTKAC